MSTSRHLGVVTGIRRQDQEVDATVQGVRLSAKYLGGRRMPWPLCEAWFEQQQAGRWLCLGPVGHRELLFHDDFLHVATPNGDTPWTLRTSGAGGTLTAETSLGVGAARVTKTVGAGVAFIHKDSDAVVVPTPPKALHLCTRFRYATDAATWFAGASANDFPNLMACAVSSDVTATTPALGTHFGVRLAGDSPTQFRVGDVVEGTTAAVGTWYVADLLVWAGTVDTASINVAYGWLDGNGPVHASGDAGAVTPMFGVYNDLTTDVGIVCSIDWMTGALVTLSPDTIITQ